MHLHKIINLLRRAKSECEHVIKDFKNVCVGASFSVQIIEFPDAGYKNNKVCQGNYETRLDREDYRKGALRKSYPYVLNERKRKANSNLPFGCTFPPIPRSRQYLQDI